MSKLRTLKVEMFKDEILSDIEKQSKMPIRITFIALFTCADSDGKFEWKPRTLKANCLPFDDVDFEKILNLLVNGKFLYYYQINNQKFGQIINFKSYQVINNRERKSELPDYSKEFDLSESIKIETEVIKRPSPRAIKIIKEQYKNEALEVLNFLNDKTGRFFRAEDSNIDLIIARLQSGITLENLRSIIAKKCREWLPDPNMKKFLRPKTLFCRSNCEQYYGELNFKKNE